VTTTSAEPATLVDRRGKVLVVTINRPQARNAVNSAVSIGVGDALERAQQDPGVWAVVITGAGDKSFCWPSSCCSPASRSPRPRR
jgi:crotonobetainyl-CoA hydratase